MKGKVFCNDCRYYNFNENYKWYGGIPYHEWEHEFITMN